MRISTSWAAVLRASNRSQPNTAQQIRYSSRNDTVRDHSMIARAVETRGQLTSGDFWHRTRRNAAFAAIHQLPVTHGDRQERSNSEGGASCVVSTGNRG